jgi:hypothetical protein
LVSENFGEVGLGGRGRERGGTNPSFTPPITNRFQIDNIFPFSCTKKISDIVALTNVSNDAAENPCTTLISVKLKKLPAKNPQALVPKRKRVEMRNTGRLPHTAAAAAVKNVPEPVVICRSPTREKDIWSAVTLNVFSISSKPVVIIGPSLLLSSASPIFSLRNWKGTHETVTPAVKETMKRIANLVLVDQFRGSFGESVGCGCRTMSPRFLGSSYSQSSSLAGSMVSLRFTVPGIYFLISFISKFRKKGGRTFGYLGSWRIPHAIIYSAV